MSVEQVPPQVDQESVEIDDFLDNSMGGTSFLFYNGEVESVALFGASFRLGCQTDAFAELPNSLKLVAQLENNISTLVIAVVLVTDLIASLSVCRPTQRKPMWTCPRHQPEGLFICLQPRGAKRVLIINQPAASRKSQ